MLVLHRFLLKVDVAIASLVKRGCEVAMVPNNSVQVEVRFFKLAKGVKESHCSPL